VSEAAPGVPDAVVDALDAFDAGRRARAAGARADRLDGGLTNRTWRVRAPGVDWVVRVGGGRDAALAIDRHAEVVALRAAAAAGLAPRLVHAEPARGIAVLEYREGRTWTRDDARSTAGLRRIGARLRELHSLPIPAGLPTLDVHAAIRRLLDRAAATPGPVDRAALAARAASVRDVSAAPASAFCHHDAHHLNVVDDGALVIVDWEYAAAGDPWVDLAAWASYHDLDGPGRATLVAAYEGRSAPTATGLAALDGACAAFEVLEALWYDAAGAWDRVERAHRDALVARLRRR
jgi:aminoglycoside phosphotransferase (APT) family kinase protein